MEQHFLTIFGPFCHIVKIDFLSGEGDDLACRVVIIEFCLFDGVFFTVKINASCKINIFFSKERGCVNIKSIKIDYKRMRRKESMGAFLKECNIQSLQWNVRFVKGK